MKKRNAQTLVEYGLLIALITIVSIATLVKQGGYFTKIGDKTNNNVSATSTEALNTSAQNVMSGYQNGTVANQNTNPNVNSNTNQTVNTTPNITTPSQNGNVVTNPTVQGSTVIANDGLEETPETPVTPANPTTPSGGGLQNSGGGSGNTCGGSLCQAIETSGISSNGSVLE